MRVENEHAVICRQLFEMLQLTLGQLLARQKLSADFRRAIHREKYLLQ
jgi:hypothetical protein